MRTAVLLNSGGMDTFLLAEQLAKCNIHAKHVFVDVGQHYLHKEHMAADRIAAHCRQPLHRAVGARMGQYEHATGIIPFRNAELILNAAQYGDDIYLGVIAHEINSDKSPEFTQAMEQVLNVSHRRQYWTEGRKFRVLTPMRHSTKSELVADHIKAGGSVRALLATVSCYSGVNANHCGNCASCFKRWVALVNNDVDVEEEFDSTPWLMHTPEEWAAKLATYPIRRVQEVMKALGPTPMGEAVVAAVRRAGTTLAAPQPGGPPASAGAAPWPPLCTYPACNCPLDAPSDPKWCARGFPRV